MAWASAAWIRFFGNFLSVATSIVSCATSLARDVAFASSFGVKQFTYVIMKNFIILILLLLLRLYRKIRLIM